jgi:hypothetical protein
METKMINRSEVMKEAWKHYRWVHATYEAWQIERGIHDGSFANALRVGWRVMKAKEAEAAKKAAMSPAVIAALDATKYLPAHMSQSAAKARILARLGL